MTPGILESVSEHTGGTKMIATYRTENRFKLLAEFSPQQCVVAVVMCEPDVHEEADSTELLSNTTVWADMSQRLGDHRGAASSSWEL